MLARLAALALLALTGGCTLSSKVALIAPGVAPSELETGNYRAYLPLEEADAAKLGALRVRSCLKRVRLVEGGDTPDSPHRMARIVYCDRDPTTRSGPYTLVLRNDAGAYWLKGPEGETQLSFKPLGEGRYLTQSHELRKTSAFDYLIAGFHGDDIEVFALGCDEFPSVKVTGALGSTICETSALDRIGPELAKVIVRIEAEAKAPLVILKRIR